MDIKMQKVAGAIIIKDKAVLITRRAPCETFAGFWEFPGGKVEESETPENCLKRELKEELDIEIWVNGFFCESIYEYPKGRIQLLTYIAEIVSGEIILTVHDKLEWANRNNLLTFGLLPADIFVAEKIVGELL